METVLLLTFVTFAFSLEVFPTTSHAPEVLCDDCCINFNDCDNYFLTDTLLSSYFQPNLSAKLRLYDDRKDEKNTFLPTFAEKINSRIAGVQHICGQKIKLHTIAPNAFAALPSLLELDLSGNKLTEIDATTFSGLLELQHLAASDNHIERLADDSFEQHAQLLCLDLHGNKLSAVHLRLSSKDVEWIDFKNNRLTAFTLKFVNGGTLERLSLQHNRLKTIKVEDVMVRGLYLGSNNLCLSFLKQEWYAGLEYLGVPDNGIQHFDFGTVKKSTNLTHLDLNQNKLSKFPIEQFSTFSKLQWLGLNDNLLIDLQVEKLPSKSHVHIANNFFKCSRLKEMLERENVFGYSEVKKSKPQYYETFLSGIRCISEDLISGKDLFALIHPVSQSTEDACSIIKSRAFLGEDEVLEEDETSKGYKVQVTSCFTVLITLLLTHLLYNTISSPLSKRDTQVFSGLKLV